MKKQKQKGGQNNKKKYTNTVERKGERENKLGK